MIQFYMRFIGGTAPYLNSYICPFHIRVSSAHFQKNWKNAIILLQKNFFSSTDSFQIERRIFGTRSELLLQSPDTCLLQKIFFAHPVTDRANEKIPVLSNRKIFFFAYTPAHTPTCRITRQ